MDSTHTFIQIHPKDNTAVALTSLKKDSVLNLDGRMYTLLEDIPQGHKFALEKISGRWKAPDAEPALWAESEGEQK